MGIGQFENPSHFQSQAKGVADKPQYLVDSGNWNLDSAQDGPKSATSGEQTTLTWTNNAGNIVSVEIVSMYIYNTILSDWLTYVTIIDSGGGTTGTIDMNKYSNPLSFDPAIPIENNGQIEFVFYHETGSTPSITSHLLYRNI